MKVTHIEFLVEEPSMAEFLNIILPKVIITELTYNIHVFQGKPDLLKKLQNRLTGYFNYIPKDWLIIVVIDEDRKDCHELKSKLENKCTIAGLYTKSQPNSEGEFSVVNRIAVEELEAWYFGDIHALCKAYPGIPATLTSKARYRNPDNIQGGTWEQLERILNRANYHGGGLSKIKATRDIAKHMNPEINKSHSFCVFRDTLKGLF